MRPIPHVVAASGLGRSPFVRYIEEAVFSYTMTPRPDGRSFSEDRPPARGGRSWPLRLLLSLKSIAENSPFVQLDFPSAYQFIGPRRHGVQRLNSEALASFSMPSYLKKCPYWFLSFMLLSIYGIHGSQVSPALLVLPPCDGRISLSYLS